MINIVTSTISLKTTPEVNAAASCKRLSNKYVLTRKLMTPGGSEPKKLMAIVPIIGFFVKFMATVNVLNASDAHDASGDHLPWS